MREERRHRGGGAPWTLPPCRHRTALLPSPVPSGNIVRQLSTCKPAYSAMQQCVRVVLPSERRAALRRPFAFAAIALPARGSKFVQEPSTGLHLEAEHCVNRFACAQLQSTGVRVKRIAGTVGVKVYALGIYVDATAVKRVLAAKFKGKAPTAEACAEAVISLTDVERNLQLVFARSVDGATVASALAERLESKVRPCSAGRLASTCILLRRLTGRKGVTSLGSVQGCVCGCKVGARLCCESERKQRREAHSAGQRRNQSFSHVPSPRVSVDGGLSGAYIAHACINWHQRSEPDPTRALRARIQLWQTRRRRSGPPSAPTSQSNECCFLISPL
jgi:hypothetical protein